jgi:hypothetical protein
MRSTTQHISTYLFLLIKQNSLHGVSHKHGRRGTRYSSDNSSARKRCCHLSLTGSPTHTAGVGLIRVVSGPEARDATRRGDVESDGLRRRRVLGCSLQHGEGRCSVRLVPLLRLSPPFSPPLRPYFLPCPYARLWQFSYLPFFPSLSSLSSFFVFHCLISYLGVYESSSAIITEFLLVLSLTGTEF